MKTTFIPARRVMYRPVLLSLFAVTLFSTSACVVESPFAARQPEATAAVGDPGDTVDKITGSGHILIGSELRTFAFNAKVLPSGAIQGQWQMNDRNSGRFAHGAVTCLTVTGNQGWIGGTVSSSSDPSLVGSDALWRVIENGQGSAASPDEISEIPFILPPGSASDFCATTPEAPPLYQVNNGNIQFH